MLRKTINMVHVNYLQGNSIYLPYATGTLVAYAESVPEINAFYSFHDIFFIREDTDMLAEKLKDSFIIGFSSYVWNFEFNKVVAKKVKLLNPECLIVFGGHHINPNGSLIDECPFIDYLVHGEGEEIFTNLLLAIAKNSPVRNIPNITFRENGKAKTTASIPVSGTDYASPYLSGCFDKILAQYPDMDFQAIIETSRGCPYCCTYCDWGNLNSKVKEFPLERICAELDWLSNQKIKFLMGADANFGIFERDKKIIDKMTELYKQTGYPENFQTSYAKLSNERIFKMTKKLHKSGMDKGVTISYQSLSHSALTNVKRDNIAVGVFSDLLLKYNHNEMATYTELIIGLPGETFDSFVDGIDIILNAGQHNSIYFHNCEWLPCSEMGKEEYVKTFKITTSLIPLNQPHRAQMENDEVKEYSKIITSTYSMTSDEWIKMNLYSVVVQCFHFGGLLQVFALYLHQEKNISFSDFYKKLLDFVLAKENPISYFVFSEIKTRLEDVIKSSGELTCEDKRFGNVMWPLDEYAFLLLAVELESFYQEIAVFLQQFEIEQDIFKSLYIYQQNIIKLPFDCNRTFTVNHQVKEYFESSLKGEQATLKKNRTSYVIGNQTKHLSWSDYAKHVVWYGKKDSKNFFTKEIHTCP